MTNLHAAAKACLDATDPTEKLRLTRAAWAAVQSGELRPDPTAPPPTSIGAPGRPEKPRLVSARQVPQRGLGSAEGRAALVHAVAHIEFNAINLAWDAVYRFRGMPGDSYRDRASCAHDEARHFALRTARLAESLGVVGLNRFRLIDWPVLRAPLMTALSFAMALSLGDMGAIALFGSEDFITLPALLYAKLGSYRSTDAAGLALILGLVCLALMLPVVRSDRRTGEPS